MHAPFRPDLNNKYDVQYFDTDFTCEEISQTPIPKKNLEQIKKNQEKFKDF